MARLFLNTFIKYIGEFMDKLISKFTNPSISVFIHEHKRQIDRKPN